MRGSEVYVSIDTHRRLRALTDLLGLACVDAAAELLLTEALQNRPEIDELITKQKQARDAVYKVWKEKLNTQQPPLSDQP